MWFSFLKLLSWPELLRAVCWTFVHSLWEGLLFALLAGIVVMFSRRLGSALRYNLLTILFSLFLFSTMVTFGWQLHSSAKPEIPQSFISESSPGITEVKEILFTPRQPVEISNQYAISKIANYLNENAMLLVGIWFILFSIKFVRLVANLSYVQKIKNYQVQDAGENWNNRIKILAAILKISRPVRLLQSALIKVPVVIGTLKPAIMIPIGMLANLPPDEIESILLHELAHIKESRLFYQPASKFRRDYLLF